MRVNDPEHNDGVYGAGKYQRRMSRRYYVWETVRAPDGELSTVEKDVTEEVSELEARLGKAAAAWPVVRPRLTEYAIPGFTDEEEAVYRKAHAELDAVLVEQEKPGGAA